MIIKVLKSCLYSLSNNTWQQLDKSIIVFGIDFNLPVHSLGHCIKNQELQLWEGFEFWDHIPIQP